MLLQDNFANAYNKLLEAAPQLDQREIQVQLGVGLGPGIKKFTMQGNTILISGKDKELGAYSAKIEITGKKGRINMVMGKMNPKVKQRIIDVFDDNGIALAK